MDMRSVANVSKSLRNLRTNNKLTIRPDDTNCISAEYNYIGIFIMGKNSEHIGNRCLSVHLLLPTYIVCRKVMFSVVSVCPQGLPIRALPMITLITWS